MTLPILYDELWEKKPRMCGVIVFSRFMTKYPVMGCNKTTKDGLATQQQQQQQQNPHKHLDSLVQGIPASIEHDNNKSSNHSALPSHRSLPSTISSDDSSMRRPPEKSQVSDQDDYQIHNKMYSKSRTCMSLPATPVLQNKTKYQEMITGDENQSTKQETASEEQHGMSSLTKENTGHDFSLSSFPGDWIPSLADGAIPILLEHSSFEGDQFDPQETTQALLGKNYNNTPRKIPSFDYRTLNGEENHDNSDKSSNVVLDSYAPKIRINVHPKPANNCSGGSLGVSDSIPPISMDLSTATTTTTTKATSVIAELTKQRESYKSEADMLRKEMDLFRTELSITRKGILTTTSPDEFDLDSWQETDDVWKKIGNMEFAQPFSNRKTSDELFVQRAENYFKKDWEFCFHRHKHTDNATERDEENVTSVSKGKDVSERIMAWEGRQGTKVSEFQRGVRSIFNSQDHPPHNQISPRTNMIPTSKHRSERNRVSFMTPEVSEECEYDESCLTMSAEPHFGRSHDRFRRVTHVERQPETKTSPHLVINAPPHSPHQLSNEATIRYNAYHHAKTQIEEKLFNVELESGKRSSTETFSHSPHQLSNGASAKYNAYHHTKTQIEQKVSHFDLEHDKRSSTSANSHSPRQLSNDATISYNAYHHAKTQIEEKLFKVDLERSRRSSNVTFPQSPHQLSNDASTKYNAYHDAKTQIEEKLLNVDLDSSKRSSCAMLPHSPRPNDASANYNPYHHAKTRTEEKKINIDLESGKRSNTATLSHSTSNDARANYNAYHHAKTQTEEKKINVDLESEKRNNITTLSPSHDTRANYNTYHHAKTKIEEKPSNVHLKSEKRNYITALSHSPSHDARANYNTYHHAKTQIEEKSLNVHLESGKRKNTTTLSHSLSIDASANYNAYNHAKTQIEEKLLNVHLESGERKNTTTLPHPLSNDAKANYNAHHDTTTKKLFKNVDLERGKRENTATLSHSHSNYAKANNNTNHHAKTQTEEKLDLASGKKENPSTLPHSLSYDAKANYDVYHHAKTQIEEKLLNVHLENGKRKNTTTLPHPLSNDAKATYDAYHDTKTEIEKLFKNVDLESGKRENTTTLPNSLSNGAKANSDTYHHAKTQTEEKLFKTVDLESGKRSSTATTQTEEQQYQSYLQGQELEVIPEVDEAEFSGSNGEYKKDMMTVQKLLRKYGRNVIHSSDRDEINSADHDMPRVQIDNIDAVIQYREARDPDSWFERHASLSQEKEERDGSRQSTRISLTLALSPKSQSQSSHGSCRSFFGSPVKRGPTTKDLTVKKTAETLVKTLNENTPQDMSTTKKGRVGKLSEETLRKWELQKR
jgi:hypothetical protein